MSSPYIVVRKRVMSEVYGSNMVLVPSAPVVLSSPSDYALITHREPIMPPALPDVSAGIGAVITDPVFNTRILRVTDATTQPNLGSDGANGKGTDFHTSSASDHNCISLLGDKFYIMNSGGGTLVYQFDANSFVTTPYSPTANSNDYNGNTSGTPGVGSVGPRIINLQNEPDFSFEDNDRIYGSKVGVAAGHPTLAYYKFSNDSYTNVLDLSTLGYDLTNNGADYGSLLAYTSMANADPAGIYGAAHGELACAMFGGQNADYAYLVAIINVSDGSIVKLFNTRQNTIGTSSGDQVWKGFTSASQVGTTLNGALNATDTTITVVATTFLPKDGVVKIDSEFITYTGTTGTTLTGCTRGAHSSTAATHSTGANVLTYGYDLHNATITRDGHYVEFTRASRTLPVGSSGNVWIWDIYNDTVTFESVDDSGHVVVGFNLLVNQNGRHDSVNYEVRTAAAPNSGIYYTSALSTDERYNLGVDGLSGAGNFAIADHTSWNNAKPNQRYAPLLSGNYRYYSGGNDPYDYGVKARAEWDDEIILIDPSPGSANRYWRACQHRSKVRGDLKATGTITWSSGTNAIVGTGTAFLTEVAIGDKINATSWDGSSGGSITTGQQRVVTGIADDTHLTVGVNFTAAGSGLNLFVANKGSGTATFWYTPRAVISQNGRFAIFTSIWEGNLGAPQSSDSSHGAFREDVFLVELPTTNPSTPTVSNNSETPVSDTSETIAFDTDLFGDSVVEYSTDGSYSSSQKDYVLKTTGHSVTLTGLTAGTAYNYRIKSRNRGVTSGYVTGTFTTTGGGSDFVTDTFIESSNTNLESHTGELGAVWAIHPSYAGAGVVDAATDRLYPTAGTAYYASGVPPSADYYVQADFHAASIISVNAAICVRMDISANTMYYVRLLDGTSWELRKLVGGSATTLASDSTPGNLPTVGNSKTVKLVVSGTSLSVYIDGTLVPALSVTDSAISAEGKAGVRFAGAASSTTGFHLDNFSAR